MKNLQKIYQKICSNHVKRHKFQLTSSFRYYNLTLSESLACDEHDDINLN